MKKIFNFQSLVLVVLLLVSNNNYCQIDNIKKSIGIFFEGLNTRDTTKIKTVCSKNFTLQTIEEKGIVSNLMQTPIKKFFQNIASVPSVMTIEEKILDCKIQIDGTMAIAWMPYEFYINEKLSHSGVNVFTMFKDEGIWKVVSIIDTRRNKL
jgi:hypothetical protein